MTKICVEFIDFLSHQGLSQHYLGWFVFLDGTKLGKLVSETMLTYHQWCLVAFWRQFHRKWSRYEFETYVKISNSFNIYQGPASLYNNSLHIWKYQLIPDAHLEDIFKESSFVVSLIFHLSALSIHTLCSQRQHMSLNKFNVTSLLFDKLGHVSTLTHWNWDKMTTILQTFQMHFFYENVWILIKISLKFVHSHSVNFWPLMRQTPQSRPCSGPPGDPSRYSDIHYKDKIVIRPQLFIFIMGIPIQVRWHLYIETPRWLCLTVDQ